jgi:hypothetical protein
MEHHPVEVLQAQVLATQDQVERTSQLDRTVGIVTLQDPGDLLAERLGLSRHVAHVDLRACVVATP